MNIRAKRQYSIRFVLALTLVTLIFGLSATTTAAYVHAAESTSVSENTSESFETSAEYQLASGEVLVTNIKDFSLSVDVIGANSVVINQRDNTLTVKLAKGTVADALALAGIKTDGNQIITPSLDTVIDGDMTVTVKQITYDEISETEPVPYKTDEIKTDSMEIGQKKLKSEGKNGEQLVTKRVKYIDGEKASEETLDTKITKEPVNEVVYVGTKRKVNTFIDQNGNAVEYKQVLSGSGTAYTAPAGALTATGAPAHHGGVAVNPNLIPYGSKLYIVSTDGSFVYGYATAVDTGGALMDGSAIVDCFYNSYNECVNFGRRNVNIYIL